MGVNLRVLDASRVVHPSLGSRVNLSLATTAYGITLKTT